MTKESTTRTSREWQPAITSLVESELDLAGATTHRSAENTIPMPSERTDARRSSCGVLSIAAPISAVLAFFGFIHLYPSDPAGFGGAFIAIYAAFGLCILGLLLSIVGFIRKEPVRWLYGLGFAINLIPSLVASSYIVRSIIR